MSAVHGAGQAPTEQAPGARWRLVVADLDGTLITGTTAAAHLDGWIGHGPVITDLERRFASGELTNTQVAESYAPLYRGIAVADAAAAMAPISSLDDIALGVGLLKDRGIEAVIATAGWSFSARALGDLWGFTDARGVDLEVDSTGRFTGRVSRHFEPEDKVGYVDEQCRRLGIGLDQVAIGDGRSDLPLFEAVGFSVALNAATAVRAAASAAIESESLLDALTAVPGLLAPPRTELQT
jgi:phosphoserine phosphatase